jgi:hypothetical protein
MFRHADVGAGLRYNCVELMENKAGVCVCYAGGLFLLQHSFGSRHGQYRLSSYQVARCNITLNILD